MYVIHFVHQFINSHFRCLTGVTLSPNRTLLDLDGCVYLTDDDIISISPHLLSLSHLSLSHCTRITDATILHIATHFPPLRVLELAGLYQVSSHSLEPLIENHNSTLESFDLAGTRVEDKTIRLALETCKNLKHVDISSCYLIIKEDEIIAEAKVRGVEVVVDSLKDGPEDWISDDAFDGEWSGGEDDAYEWGLDAACEDDYDTDEDDDDFDEDYEYGLED